MLSQDQVLEILKETNVLQEGHYSLTSGRHSRQYMQCAQVLQYPEEAAKLCRQFALYAKDKGMEVDLVVGPATGGIVLAYETARIMGVKTMFAERESGEMTFRRGFHIEPGQRVFVVEDVITTGGSVKEVIQLIQEQGGIVVGVGVLVDRTDFEIDFGVPHIALLKIDIESYEPSICPLCKESIPITKPGSRGLKL